MATELFNQNFRDINLQSLNDLTINLKYIDLYQTNGLTTFNKIFHSDFGQVFRENKVRCVRKIELTDKDGVKRVFHLKTHTLNWKEKLKDLFYLTVEDGKNEWEKIILLNSLDILTMMPVVFGEKKQFGLSHQSLTITEHLYDFVRLEDFIEENFAGSTNQYLFELKINIIDKLAKISRHFHNFGFNHNDFYLGHFFIKKDPLVISMIDLQRVVKRKKIRTRDRIKDLAQLYFSSTQIKGVDLKDCLRFLKKYLNVSKLRNENKKMIKMIIKKNDRINKHTEKILKFEKER